MKHIVKISLAAAAMLTFAACDNSDYELDNLIPDQYKRVVCIQDSQRGDLQLFDVGIDLDTEFTILRSGGDPSLEASTKIVSMTQDELSEYSQDFLLVDPKYYTVSETINFAPNERYKKIAIVFSADQVEAMKADCNDGNHYIALKLEQDGQTSVDGDKSYILRKIDIRSATLQISGTELIDNQFSVTLSVPFANQWTIAYELEFVSEMAEKSTALGNSLEAKYVLSPMPEGTVIENRDMMALEPGVTEMTHTITLPDQVKAGFENFAVRIKSATLDGNEMEIANSAIIVSRSSNTQYKPEVTQSNSAADADYFGKGLANYSAWGAMTLVDRAGFKYNSQSANNSVADAIDGNTGSFWDNNWGGGYGTKDLPFEAVLDLGQKSAVDAVEFWRRPGDYVSDTKTVEIYATETCSHKEGQVTYGDLTYIGTAYFGTTKERLMYQLTSHVETQYLIFRFTESNRGGNCISIAEYNVWHR